MTIGAVRLFTASMALMCASAGMAQNIEPDPRVTITSTLQLFVDDYARDPMAIDITFGIEVDDMHWHVVSKTVDGVRRTSLQDGFPEGEYFYFTASRETLNLLDRGVWNGLTAMGAATSADLTPLDQFGSEGFVEPEDFAATLRPLLQHFWTRGWPEVVSFGPSNSRVVHGAPATVLYYDKDFRSAVYHVPAGLGPENAPTIQVPFPRMILVMSGEAVGEMGGESFSAKPGQMLFSPPNIPVKFWNGSADETLSFVWLMWGDGA